MLIVLRFLSACAPVGLSHPIFGLVGPESIEYNIS
jgi:hypothetical protein